MRVVLLRVGIDTGAGGMHGPLFQDGTFEFIPIPGDDVAPVRTYGNTRGRWGRFLIEYFPAAVQPRMASVSMHFDPEFETFTYGDPTLPKRGLRTLAPGDLLVFYAGLQGWDHATTPALYVVGYFEVLRAGLATSFTNEEIHSLFNANAHVRDPRVLEDQYERLVLVKGGPGSRLLMRAACISEMSTDTVGHPLKVISSRMRGIFGDFGGRLSLQRSPPRWVDQRHVEVAARFIRELE